MHPFFARDNFSNYERDNEARGRIKCYDEFSDNEVEDIFMFSLCEVTFVYHVIVKGRLFSLRFLSRSRRIA